MPCKQTVATIWTKGTANWVKWWGTAVAERGWKATLHLVHGARGLESMVAQGFVKHGFKVLLHGVVDGPLQASRWLVSRTPCVYTWYTRVFQPLAAMPSIVAGDKLYTEQLYTFLVICDLVISLANWYYLKITTATEQTKNKREATAMQLCTKSSKLHLSPRRTTYWDTASCSQPKIKIHAVSEDITQNKIWAKVANKRC